MGLAGAHLLAMVVNDNAGCLNARVVLALFASSLAPARGRAYIRERGSAVRSVRRHSVRRKPFPPKSATAFAPLHKPFGRCFKRTYPRVSPQRRGPRGLPRMPWRLTRTRGLAL
ncbi:hypothetical protein EKG40_04795 [Pseudomonas moorei]|nr:hypothetical protein EKG40_04795 [Pseudomonas moorei]